ncbi:hypothetical protein ACE6H2_009098 [Prunus campanulata]
MDHQFGRGAFYSHSQKFKEIKAVISQSTRSAVTRDIPAPSYSFLHAPAPFPFLGFCYFKKHSVRGHPNLSLGHITVFRRLRFYLPYFSL